MLGKIFENLGDSEKLALYVIGSSVATIFGQPETEKMADVIRETRKRAIKEINERKEQERSTIVTEEVKTETTMGEEVIIVEPIIVKEEMTIKEVADNLDKTDNEIIVEKVLEIHKIEESELEEMETEDIENQVRIMNYINDKGIGNYHTEKELRGPSGCMIYSTEYYKDAHDAFDKSLNVFKIKVDLLIKQEKYEKEDFAEIVKETLNHMRDNIQNLIDTKEIPKEYGIRYMVIMKRNFIDATEDLKRQLKFNEAFKVFNAVYDNLKMKDNQVTRNFKKDFSKLQRLITNSKTDIDENKENSLYRLYKSMLENMLSFQFIVDAEDYITLYNENNNLFKITIIDYVKDNSSEDTIIRISKNLTKIEKEVKDKVREEKRFYTQEVKDWVETFPDGFWEKKTMIAGLKLLDRLPDYYRDLFLENPEIDLDKDFNTAIERDILEALKKATSYPEILAENEDDVIPIRTNQGEFRKKKDHKILANGLYHGMWTIFDKVLNDDPRFNFIIFKWYLVKIFYKKSRDFININAYYVMDNYKELNENPELVNELYIRGTRLIDLMKTKGDLKAIDEYIEDFTRENKRKPTVKEFYSLLEKTTEPKEMSLEAKEKLAHIYLKSFRGPIPYNELDVDTNTDYELDCELDEAKQRFCDIPDWFGNYVDVSYDSEDPLKAIREGAIEAEAKVEPIEVKVKLPDETIRFVEESIKNTNKDYYNEPVVKEVMDKYKFDNNSDLLAKAALRDAEKTERERQWQENPEEFLREEMLLNGGILVDEYLDDIEVDLDPESEMLFDESVLNAINTSRINMEPPRGSIDFLKHAFQYHAYPTSEPDNIDPEIVAQLDIDPNVWRMNGECPEYIPEDTFENPVPVVDEDEFYREENPDMVWSNKKNCYVPKAKTPGKEGKPVIGTLTKQDGELLNELVLKERFKVWEGEEDPNYVQPTMELDELQIASDEELAEYQ